MPKLLQLGSGDQFFMVDDTHYFWDKITQPTYMMYGQQLLNIHFIYLNSLTYT